jgi:hypothetical protein
MSKPEMQLPQAANPSFFSSALLRVTLTWTSLVTSSVDTFGSTNTSAEGRPPQHPTFETRTIASAMRFSLL